MLRTALCLAVATARSLTAELPTAYADRLKPSECFVKLEFETPKCDFVDFKSGVPNLLKKLLTEFTPYNVRKEKISLTGIRAARLSMWNYNFFFDMTLAFDTCDEAHAALKYAHAWIANPPPASPMKVKVWDRLHEYLTTASIVPYEHYYVLHTVVSSAFVRAHEFTTTDERLPLYVNGVETPFMALSDPSLLPSESSVVGHNCSYDDADVIALNAIAVLTSDAVNACLKPKPELRECVDCSNALKEIANLETPSCYNRHPLDPFLYGATYAERIDLSYALDKQYYNAECLHRRRLGDTATIETLHNDTNSTTHVIMHENSAFTLAPSLLAFLIACVLSK